LDLEDFYQLVYSYHPIAQQSELITERGELALREGRGFFDPKLISNLNTKDFKGTDYYELWDSYLKIPTPLNIDFKAGYERNRGDFVNNQNFLPVGGLYYAGVSVPVGRGLLLNDNLYALRSGKLDRRKLRAEALQVLNNLFLDATVTYWQWYASFRKVILLEEALDLAKVRFEGIRQGVLNGENAPIDSVESQIQVQIFSNDLFKARLEFDNSWLLMQNMIWDTEVMEGTYRPDSIIMPRETNLGLLENFALSNHPDLLDLTVQNEQLQLDKKLFAEQLRPQLDLNYNFLLQTEGEEAGQFQANNYKAGFEFSFPILLRKERAKVKAAKVKISENELKLDQKTRQVINKVRAAYNQIVVNQQMIDQQVEAVRNYETMLEGERAKFDNGESSVFLVNSRENKLVEGKLKLVELEAAYQIYLGTLYWASGYFPTWLNENFTPPEQP
jgi:outer membrane protein TolC